MEYKICKDLEHSERHAWTSQSHTVIMRSADTEDAIFEDDFREETEVRRVKVTRAADGEEQEMGRATGVRRAGWCAGMVQVEGLGARFSGERQRRPESARPVVLLSYGDARTPA